jgi:peptidoglycan/LPS O-acetylase OafA/YrhL
MLALRHVGLLPLHTFPALLTALAVTIPIAAASWRWVERPAIERARVVALRWRRPATAERIGRAAWPAAAAESRGAAG